MHSWPCFFQTNRLTHELAGMERKQNELVTQYQQQVDQLHKEVLVPTVYHSMDLVYSIW